MVAQSVAEILRNHVSLSVEGIDRMYLNVYVPTLQRDKDVAWFFRGHRQQPFASSALMAPMSRHFVAKLERYARKHEIEVVQFRPGERKDDVMAERLKRFEGAEGVVFIGKAQEKTAVFRTEKRHSPNGRSYPWIVRSSAMVNHYYIYAVDRDFGPFFLKFSSYFPYTAKLCLNGHEYAKQQLAKEGIAFEALDNGIQSCADPQRLQAICDGLSPAKIDALLRPCHPEQSEARISPNDQTRAARLACSAEARRLLRATQDDSKARLWMPSQHKEFDTFGR